MNFSIEAFLEEGTWGPFRRFIELMSLPPERTWEWVSFLAAFMILCELTRLALGTVFTRSVIVHVARCLLTFAVQSIALAVVLAWANHRHPERGWINLGYAFLMYVVWYAAGQLTHLARPDNEGADLGFMTVGALITFPVGVVTALL